MRRLLLASAILGSFATTAHSEVLFLGRFQYTSVLNCPNGPSVGDANNIQFHLRGVGGNDNFTAFTLIDDFGGQEYTLANGLDFTSTFQVVSNSGLGWSIYTPPEPSFVKITTMLPELIKLTATTPSITFAGAIRNPYGDAGASSCVANFRAVVLLKLR